MGGYLAFASRFAPAAIDGGEAKLFWVHRFEKNGLQIRIAGLNTSLLCAGDDDRGKLRLGKQQLHETLGDPPARGEIVIALTHHPLRVWLEDGDARGAEALIRNDAHVHLFGHVHEAETDEVRGGGLRGGMVRVVAGAVHNERQPEPWIPAGHGYNWGAVVDDGTPVPKLWIWPRVWSDRNADFRVDVNNVPRGKQHAEHTLPETVLPVAPAGTRAAGGKPADGTPADGKEVEVFSFYAPEDDDLVKKLETHLKLLRKRRAISAFSWQTIGLGASAAGAAGEAVRRARSSSSSRALRSSRPMRTTGPRGRRRWSASRAARRGLSPCTSGPSTATTRTGRRAPSPSTRRSRTRTTTSVRGSSIVTSTPCSPSSPRRSAGSPRRSPGPDRSILRPACPAPRPPRPGRAPSSRSRSPSRASSCS